jgi:holliday junction DNA helicase RuvA
MIAQLNGTIISKTSTEVVVDCGGVGYLVFISVITSEHLPEISEKARIFTLLIPREDALQLFGFWSESEREAFKLLTSISGIGPKIALGILSSVSIKELQEYIFTGNIIALTKLPGIGKKTAERIILELRDRISKLGEIVEIGETGSQNLIKQEAMSALITLGYNRLIAEKSVRRVIEENSGRVISAEEIIRKALKYAMS